MFCLHLVSVQVAILWVALQLSKNRIPYYLQSHLAITFKNFHANLKQPYVQRCLAAQDMLITTNISRKTYSDLSNGQSSPRLTISPKLRSQVNRYCTKADPNSTLFNHNYVFFFSNDMIVISQGMQTFFAKWFMVPINFNQ